MVSRSSEASCSKSSRRRPARRRARRGAAVFVVMLVIAGLSAAGLFAVRASLTSLDGAGRHRQMVQTQLIAEMGLSLSVSELARDGQRYKAQLIADYVPPGVGQRVCRSASPARKQCVRIGLQQLESQLANSSTPPPSDFAIFQPKPDPAAPSGIGFGDVRANFGSEVVDVSVGPPAPGYPMSSITSSMAFYRFTVTTNGQVIPTTSAGADLNVDASADAKFAASTVQARAQVLVGPLH